MTNRLSKDGYKVLGTDLSEDMLDIAQNKAYDKNLKVRYVQQDMTDIELFQTYDAIVSFCDGFNYLIEEEDFDKAIKNCYDYLNDDGLLIFDMSSDYKLKHVLGDNVFTETSEEVSFIWENYYDAETKILEFDLALFIKENNMYARTDEVHKQRAYTIDEIKTSLDRNGIELLTIKDTNTNEKITEKSERWLFIGRKINE
jgi:SAM-dependent methyltransferase